MGIISQLQVVSVADQTNLIFRLDSHHYLSHAVLCDKYGKREDSTRDCLTFTLSFLFIGCLLKQYFHLFHRTKALRLLLLPKIQHLLATRRQSSGTQLTAVLNCFEAVDTLIPMHSIPYFWSLGTSLGMNVSQKSENCCQRNVLCDTRLEIE